MAIKTSVSFNSFIFQTSYSAVPAPERQTGAEALDTPKHPEFASESERMSTFRTWGVQSPEILCRAGFYYTGVRYFLNVY